MTLVGGLAITLFVSAGIKNDIEFLDGDSKTEEKYSSYIGNESMGSIDLIAAIGDPIRGGSVKIEDVKVYEMEEAVDLGFDTLDYLPMGFNPVEDLKIEEQLEYEREYVFKRVFGEIEENEVLKIEDINFSEFEEAM